MFINEYFKTPIWIEQKPEFVKSINQATNPYIKKARNNKEAKAWIKTHGDFGRSYHSTPLTHDNNCLDLRNYIGQQSWQFLDWQGFDMSKYQTIFSEMWVQEFAKKGGGHHAAHHHWNQHVSGFYFLKASDKTSMPIFYDPRQGARMTKLHQKKPSTITHASEQMHYKVKPGTLIIFPGYMLHEFSVDHGKEPFRFIHWNITAIPKEMAREPFSEK